MNERIKELAEQATTIVEMVGPQGYASSYANFDREKFAQLIVQECMNVLDPGEHQLIARFQARKWLAEHFGVEE